MIYADVVYHIFGLISTDNVNFYRAPPLSLTAFVLNKL